jgi:hypothetical protein
MFTLTKQARWQGTTVSCNVPLQRRGDSHGCCDIASRGEIEAVATEVGWAGYARNSCRVRPLAWKSGVGWPASGAPPGCRFQRNVTKFEERRCGFRGFQGRTHAQREAAAQIPQIDSYLLACVSTHGAPQRVRHFSTWPSIESAREGEGHGLA